MASIEVRIPWRNAHGPIVSDCWWRGEPSSRWRLLLPMQSLSSRWSLQHGLLFFFVCVCVWVFKPAVLDRPHLSPFVLQLFLDVANWLKNLRCETCLISFSLLYIFSRGLNSVFVTFLSQRRTHGKMADSIGTFCFTVHQVPARPSLPRWDSALLELCSARKLIGCSYPGRPSLDLRECFLFSTVLSDIFCFCKNSTVFEPSQEEEALDWHSLKIKFFSQWSRQIEQEHSSCASLANNKKIKIKIKKIAYPEFGSRPLDLKVSSDTIIG